jgi:hypothetical protein
MGLREPQSLEEWANMALGSNLLPWLQGSEYQRTKRMLSYFVLNHQLVKRRRRLPPLRRLMSKLVAAPLRWRLRHKYYRFPLELWMMRLRNRLVLRRSLLTGQSLGHDLERIC